MRFPRPTILLAMSMLIASAQAQGKAPEGVTDWRMPFRNPLQNIEPPLEHFEQLRIMRQIAGAPGEYRVYNENGRELCTHPDWKRAYDRLLSMRQDAGYLSLILRDSASPLDRELALFGMFYIPDARLVFSMIEHIPGEPARALREESYQRAIEFIKVHLAHKNDGNVEDWGKIRVGPAGKLPPKPGEYSYSFEPAPFVALLKVKDWRDHVQGLWFLTESITVRPELRLPFFEQTLDVLPDLLESRQKAVVDQACKFLARIDPTKSRHLNAKSDSEELIAWLDSCIYDVFPPIRRISDGLYDLHPSDDLDKLYKLGTALLTDGSLGDTAEGNLANKQYYRGLRISRMPDPLDKLGFEIGDIITSVNGTPIATTLDLLNTLRTLRRQTRFSIEFVSGRKKKARHFRLHKS